MSSQPAIEPLKTPVIGDQSCQLGQGEIASALANGLSDRAATQTSEGLFIGMDEAGYGPNLGPLLIVMTCWKTPGTPQTCDFYRLLRQSVSPTGAKQKNKLHIADSKLVNVGKEGFRSLEISALALLKSLGLETSDFHTLCDALTSNVRGSGCNSDHLPAGGSLAIRNSAPWYADNLELPVTDCLEQAHRLAGQFSLCMQSSGVELIDIQADLVVEQRYNQLVERNLNNKGLTLSRLAFRLLRANWSPANPRPALIVGDKHGGRNRYDELLSEVLDQEMILRIEEGQQISRYRIGHSELRFQVGGEAHLPVACASMIAKYLRELSMRLFNRYWSQHCPDVKPTLGYPNDARRFREQVEAVRRHLDIADHLFWRIK